MQHALNVLDSLITQVELVDNSLSGSFSLNMASIPDEKEQSNLTSWVPYDADSHFPIQNIPFGVFEQADGSQHIGTRIGDHVLDLFKISKLGLLSKLPDKGVCFTEE